MKSSRSGLGLTTLLLEVPLGLIRSAARSLAPGRSGGIRRLLPLVPSVFGLLSSLPAYSSPIVDPSGQLTGATDVNVNGVFYDVQFIDGSCITLFSGCDAAADLDFPDPQAAQDAAQALVDQVFLDGQLGAFDTDPKLTRGCEENSFDTCHAIVPSEQILTPFGSCVAARNTDYVTYNDGPIPINCDPSGDTSGNPQFVFARFTPANQPLADAGPDQAVRLGDTVFLDGGNSFDDDTATESLQFAWSFVSVTSGSSAVLAGADTATPSFVADAAGTYVVRLTVTDEAGLTSAPDEMTVRMPLVDASGQLTGATDVNVNGVLYDVQFIDGSCITLFSGCDAAADLDFPDPQAAQDAAQALVDQVFLDGQLGAFDTDPKLTRGCEENVFDSCHAIVPSEQILSPFGTCVVARNTDYVTYNDGPIPSSCDSSGDTSGNPQFVFARFTPAVAIGDADNDGVLDGDDNCPSIPNPDQSDTDLDGAGDACDEDDDDDGVPDDDDLCPDTGVDEPVDAAGCSDAQVDGDGDGVCDPGAASGGPLSCTGSDNCPDDANPGQEDLDQDGVGDGCDDDADGDGDPATSDCDDLDPTRYAGATEICTDGVDNDCDGQVDEIEAGADCDGDGIPNEWDNCPLAFNEFQENLDGDEFGDVCDEDIDGDTVLNDEDNCPVDANIGQEDLDGDGAGDVCDHDADGDGLLDATDDLCLGTTTDPDAGVPSRGLGKNRWAEMDGNAQFDTNGKNPTGRMYSIYTAGGCNCAQIIEICGYGQGHTKFGCSNSVMDWWTGLYDRDGEAPFQCDE